MDINEETQINKPHHKSKSGKKANEKKKNSIDTNDTKHKNPKAFVPSSLKKARDRVIRKAIVTERRLHVPLVDHNKRSVPPPFVVAVQGPPGVGKSTLIQSLVKHYVNKNLKLVKGPITVLINRKRRVTFFEVPNDLGAMVDIGKIADLAILMIDGNYGFEMETFEFLNILQTHGFPRVLGVITHLDLFKNMTQAQKMRKKLRLRFQVEVAKNARVFNMSNIKYERYEKKDVMNLARYISYLKSRPLTWRNSHPYVLVDRVIDFTPQERIKDDKNCDRSICFYGYMRGSNLKSDMILHIPGVGDHTMTRAFLLDDPCPLPEKSASTSSVFKDRILYAPMSDVGLVMYDQDAIYIELNRDPIYQPVGSGSNVRTVPEGSEGEKMMRNLYTNRNTMEDALESTKFKLFSNSDPIDYNEWQDPDESNASTDTDGDQDQSSLSDAEDHFENEDYYKDDEPHEPREYIRDASRRDARFLSQKHDGEKNTHIEFDDSLSELDISDTSAGISECEDSEEESLVGRGRGICTFENRKSLDMEKVIYDCESGGRENQIESCRDDCDIEENLELDEEGLQSLKEQFVNEEDSHSTDENENANWEDLEEKEKEDSSSEDEDQGDGSTDWEALKVADKLKFNEAFDQAKSEGRKFELPILPSNVVEAKSGPAKVDEMTYYDKMKASFESKTMENEAAFAELDEEQKIKFQGFHSGQYVKILIDNLPSELIENFDPHFPLLLGGLMPTEQSLSMVQVRLKKHRWYPKILKTNDPIIFSLGWRRFQSLPIYSLEDKHRNRMLKYTPEYTHCIATFYGPITPPGTGFVAFQTASNNVPQFRIVANGLVTNLDKSHEIVKKLKLKGVPYRIKGLNAFIKGMFNSRLEVAKFHKAAIRTVSGIRGQVGKPVRDKEGAFRGRFEDRLKLSDIVFLKTWYPIKPKAFYNPMTSILLKDKSSWVGMKPIGLLKKELGISTPVNKDSMYREVKRSREDLQPLLQIPKRLKKILPFNAIPELDIPNKKIVEKEKQRARIRIVDPVEKRKLKLVRELTILREDALEKQRKKRQERIKSYKEKKERELMEAEKRVKEHRDNVYRLRRGKPLKNV